MALKFRRGTTAQQSGSLAFGEPYVNTDLGTLLVGGTNGDIILSSTGTGSNLVVNDITASGNLSVAGNATIGGKITIGDNSSDTVTVVASLSSSLIPTETNTFDLGDLTHFWRDLYISTGSIKMVNPATNQVVTTINSVAGGGIQIGNVQITTQSIAFVDNSGNVTQNVAQSSSVAGVVSDYVTTSSFNAYTQSASSSVSSLSSSVKAVTDTFATSASVATATANSISTFSASVKAVTDTFAVSSSVANTISTLSSSIANEQYSKLNAANTFNANQTISGSLFVAGNVLIQGSSSLQNITASAASIGTNTVILNTSTPGVRFGGIAVQDSGSGAGASGSLLWDSVNDVWIYQNPDGAGYASAKLISGPKNSGSLGSETGLTVGQVLVAVGDDHIGDSIISASATKVTIAGALDTTGNVSASTISGIGNVSAYSVSVDSRIATIETSYATSASIASATATSISTLSGSIFTTNDTQTTNITANSASAAGAFASASAYSGSFYTTINTVIGTVTTAQNSANGAYASASAYSSSQYTRDANQDTTITTNTNAAAGAFASASAYSASAATTYAKLAVANTFTANQIVSGSITATGDVVAYSTSDKRHKHNIVLISDALSKVTKLNGVTWEWNEDVDDATKETPKTGLIAQEVQEVLPEVVKERGDGFLALDYSKTIGLLVEAIKEQQTQIHSLTLEIEKLKKNNSL